MKKHEKVNKVLNAFLGDESLVYGCDDDPNMPNLEEIVYSNDDEGVDAKADMTNLDTNILASPTLTTRIHKDHPLEHIIGDIHSAPQTRRMIKNVTEHVEPKKDKKDGRGIVIRNNLDSPFDFEAFSDSDYASSSLDKKSTTGGCLEWNGMAAKDEIQVSVVRVTYYWKAKRTVEISQSSGPIPLVTDETIIKEWEYRMERAATTASSLEAEQDSGIIDFLNASSIKYALTVNPTVYESCIKQFWATAKAKTVNGDRQIQALVPDLEEAKTAQVNEISSLKNRVNQLEKRRNTRTSGLKRLRKVGSTSRVESSNDVSLGAQEDASKQERKIADLDDDVEVTLIDETQERNDEDLMFDSDVLNGDEAFEEPIVNDAKTTSPFPVSVVDPVTIAGEVVTTASATTAVDELTLAPTLIEIKATKPKAIATVATTITIVVASTRPKAKGIVAQEEASRVAIIEELDSIQAMIEADEQLATRLQAEEQEQFSIEEKSRMLVEMIAERKKFFAAQRAAEQKMAKKQKIDDDQEEAEMKKLIKVVPNEEEVAIDAILLATKPPSIVDWKIIKEGKISQFQIIRADGSSKRPEEGYERVLWWDIMTIFEPDVEIPVWRTMQNEKVLIWKLFDSCGVHFLRLQSMHLFMLVEKRYLLTPATITNILNKKLQTDHLNEMISHHTTS
ncbi:hypothetical protein Tco_0436644 [Tanacetum coccineum]